MRKKLVGSILVLGVMGLSSVAVAFAPIVQTQSYSGTPDYQQTLTFNQFDDLSGSLTLQSIFIEIDLEADGGALRCDNDADTASSGAIEFGAEVTVSSTDVSLLDATSFPIFQPGDVKATGGTTLNLAANDGDTEVGGTAFFSYAGPDYDFYLGGTESDDDSGYVSSLTFGQYTGTGTYDITLDASQVADYGALGGVQAQIDPLTADGEVTVIYTYIPEPATLGLLALGGLMIARRRRAA